MRVTDPAALPIRKAFLLGAGLGTRLRPLTHVLPKPLVPFFHEPLCSHAIAACQAAGVEEFAINTHHLPHAWESFSAPGDPPVTYFHEPVLLETGGGLKNLQDWIGGETLLVHNGDIHTTQPLAPLIAAHRASSLPVTLALRSTGDALHVAIDPSGARVTDIRGKLGVSEGTHLFSGIYCVEPEFLELIPAGEKISVIPAFLELARQGRLGAVVIDDGLWLELGDHATYLEAHQTLQKGNAIHPDAIIATDAVVERSVIGPGARIGAGSTVRDSVVWPGNSLAPGAVVERCIVYSGRPVEGSHTDADL